MKVVEIGLISVCWIGVDVDFSLQIGIDLFLCSGRKRLVFDVWIEIGSVVVSEHRNSLDNGEEIEDDVIQRRDETWLLGG